MTNFRLFSIAFSVTVVAHRLFPFGAGDIIEGGLLGTLFGGLCIGFLATACFGDRHKLATGALK